VTVNTLGTWPLSRPLTSLALSLFETRTKLLVNCGHPNPQKQATSTKGSEKRVRPNEANEELQSRWRRLKVSVRPLYSLE
jgi:hypothetical protein